MQSEEVVLDEANGKPGLDKRQRAWEGPMSPLVILTGVDDSVARENFETQLGRSGVGLDGLQK